VAREGDLRQLVRRENRNFEHFGTCADRFAVDQASAVGDADDARRGRLRDVIDAEQTTRHDLFFNVLLPLVDRGGSGVLVVVDEAAGQAPKAVARLDGAPAQHDPDAGLHDHRGSDLGVVPQDVAVLRAYLELTPFDRLQGKRRAAVDAEVRHRAGL